jgi:ATP-dependent exoDNAse (exonuclease V) beta subunit
MGNVIDSIQMINEERFSDMGNRSIISVSKLEEFVTAKFDKEASAKKCEEKGKTDPNYKYAGMTAEEIIKKWEDKADESKMYGRLLDEYTEQIMTKGCQDLELWKLDNNFDSDMRLMNNCHGFDEFYEDIKKFNYEFVGREIPVYYETPSTLGEMPFDNKEDKGHNVVTGRIDALFYNKTTGKYLIVDWKTTDDIKTESFHHKMMYGPANKWEDCDMGKYSIQLYIYKQALIYTYKLTEENNISECVCNLLKEKSGNTLKNYLVYKPIFTYNPKIMNQVIDFSIMKRELMKRKN